MNRYIKSGHCDAQSVDEVTPGKRLIHSQLFYFNGDKQQAYKQLVLYLDARLIDCKLKCYTCEQRTRHGSVPFSCECCRVASYCGRKHQKLTWKNECVCCVPCLGTGARRRRGMGGRMKIDAKMKGNLMRSLGASALLRRQVIHLTMMD